MCWCTSDSIIFLGVMLCENFVFKSSRKNLICHQIYNFKTNASYFKKNLSECILKRYQCIHWVNERTFNIYRECWPLHYFKKFLSECILKRYQYIHWVNERTFNIYRECWPLLIAFQTIKLPKTHLYCPFFVYATKTTYAALY